MNQQIYISQIMELLPHRYPFLLVDRVEEIEVGKPYSRLQKYHY